MLDMAKSLTADDLLPLIAGLPTLERVRLLRLITGCPDSDPATVYRAQPPRPDEFSTDDEPLAWDAEGWEALG